MDRRSKLVGLLLWFVCAVVFAQAVPATDPVPRVAFPRTNVGSVTTFGPMTADASNAAKFSFGVAANGSVFSNTGVSLPTAGGASVPLNVAGTVSKAGVVSALGRFIIRGMPLLNTGVALYDLSKELGYVLNNSSGSVVVTKLDPNACTVLPCYKYRTSIQGYPGELGDRSTACSTAAASFNDNDSTFNALNAHVVEDAGYGQCVSDLHYKSNGNFLYQMSNGFTRYSAAVSPSTYLTSSHQEFLDSISAKSGWPSSSALARTLLDSLKSGVTSQVDPVTVTGPATSPGPVTVTSTANDPASNPDPNPVTNPNTTTTTSTVTNNYTYGGTSVTQSSTTNVTTVNNSTGAVTNNSSSTTSPETKDAPLDLCKEHPEILACQKFTPDELTPVAVANTNRQLSINKDTGWGPENGTCPAPKTAVVMGVSLSMPFDLICQLATTIRPLIIGLAWLSAALTFFGLGRKE